MQWSVNAKRRYAQLETIPGTRRVLRSMIETSARLYLTAEVRPVHVAMGWRAYRQWLNERARVTMDAGAV